LLLLLLLLMMRLLLERPLRIVWERTWLERALGVVAERRGWHRRWLDQRIPIAILLGRIKGGVYVHHAWELSLDEIGLELEKDLQPESTFLQLSLTLADEEGQVG